VAFRDELSVACEEYATKYNFKATDLSRGFEAFVVHLSAADGHFMTDPSAVADPMNSDLSDFILRQNDGGVDGYLEDESNKVVLLIQAKYQTGKNGLNEDAIRSFFDVPNVLTSPGRDDYLSKLDPRAQALLLPLGERLKDGWTLALRFMTNRPISERERALAAARQSAYSEQGRRVRCEMVGQDGLKAIWREAISGQGGIGGSVTIKLVKDRFVDLGDPRPTLVSVISGNELANLFKQYGNQLFAQNIRLPLLGSTRINPDIEDTAKNRPDDFFYFNNGVSALCSKYEESDGTVEAFDLQIINGAQTVGTLGSMSNLSSKVRVLFRLSSAPAGDTSFREEITRTNNTQNEVVPWDFRANDAIQKWLEVQFKPYSGQGPIPNFWYKRKRGLVAGGKGGRALEPEYLGKLRHAYLYGPVPSYKEPKRLASLAEDTGLYAETFGINGEIVNVWPKSALDEAMFAYALDFYIAAKADQYRKDGHQYGRWLKRLSRYMVAIIGKISRDASALKLEPKILVTLSSSDFASRIDPTLRAAMSKVNDKYNEMKESRVQPEYDIARDQKLFDILSNAVIADLTA
jgi:hypothetical protein